MFAAVAQIGIRIAPVALRIVTNPRVISTAIQTVGITAAFAGIRAAKLEGKDKVAQTEAESIHSETDPAAYADDPRRVRGFKQRLGRNAWLMGAGFAEEGRAARLLITPPTQLVCFVKVKATEKRYTRLLSKVVVPVDIEVPADQPKLIAKVAKVGNRLSRRRAKLNRVKAWYRIEKMTPGEQYLAEQLTVLKERAVANESRVDSVEALYTRSLEDAIDLSSVDFTDARKAGAAVYLAVTTNFKGDEVGLIRSRVLKGWLVKHRTVSDSQWRKFTQGWSDASRVAQSV